MSVFFKIREIEKQIKRSPYYNTVKTHFVSWRDWNINMTAEDKKALTAPYQKNIVIIGLATKEDNAEFGDMIQANWQKQADEKR